MTIKATALGVLCCGVPSLVVPVGYFLHTKSKGGETEQNPTLESSTTLPSELPHEVPVSEESVGEGSKTEEEIPSSGNEDLSGEPAEQSSPESPDVESHSSQEKGVGDQADPVPSSDTTGSESPSGEEKSSTETLETESPVNTTPAIAESNEGRGDVPVAQDKGKEDGRGEETSENKELDSKLEKPKETRHTPKVTEISRWRIITRAIRYFRGI